MLKNVAIAALIILLSLVTIRVGVQNLICGRDLLAATSLEGSAWNVTASELRCSAMDTGAVEVFAVNPKQDTRVKILEAYNDRADIYLADGGRDRLLVFLPTETDFRYAAQRLDKYQILYFLYSPDGAVNRKTFPAK